MRVRDKNRLADTVKPTVFNISYIIRLFYAYLEAAGEQQVVNPFRRSAKLVGKLFP